MNIIIHWEELPTVVCCFVLVSSLLSWIDFCTSTGSYCMRCGVVWSGCGVLVFDCTFCGIDQMYVLEERSCKTCDIPRGCPGGNNNGNFFYVNRALRSMSLHDWCCWRHASTFPQWHVISFIRVGMCFSLCPKTILQSSNTSADNGSSLLTKKQVWTRQSIAPKWCLPFGQKLWRQHMPIWLQNFQAALFEICTGCSEIQIFICLVLSTKKQLWQEWRLVSTGETQLMKSCFLWQWNANANGNENWQLVVLLFNDKFCHSDEFCLSAQAPCMPRGSPHIFTSSWRMCKRFQLNVQSVLCWCVAWLLINDTTPNLDMQMNEWTCAAWVIWFQTQVLTLGTSFCSFQRNQRQGMNAHFRQWSKNKFSLSHSKCLLWSCNTSRNALKNPDNEEQHVFFCQLMKQCCQIQNTTVNGSCRRATNQQSCLVVLGLTGKDQTLTFSWKGSW